MSGGLCADGLEETKGGRGPSPAPQEGVVAGDPWVLQLCTHQHSPRRVPSLPYKDHAPPDVAAEETKKSPAHKAEQPPASAPVTGEQRKDLQRGPTQPELQPRVCEKLAAPEAWFLKAAAVTPILTKQKVLGHTLSHAR